MADSFLIHRTYHGPGFNFNLGFIMLYQKCRLYFFFNIYFYKLLGERLPQVLMLSPAEVQFTAVFILHLLGNELKTRPDQLTLLGNLAVLK